MYSLLRHIALEASDRMMRLCMLLVSAGGYISDLCGRRWGIRGRVWWLFICQMLGGITCLALGLAKDSFTWTMVSCHGCALQHDPVALHTPHPWAR